MFLSGCASTPASRENSNVAIAGSAVSDRRDRQAIALEDVERQYLIGPTAARELGYRIDWQLTGTSSAAKHFEIQRDSVLLLDNRNLLTRIDREQGQRIWSLPVAEEILEIQGVNYVPESERVYVTAGGSLIVLDAANGSQVGRQRLQRVANTSPVQFGQFLIYGSRSGQLIWHSFPIAYQWRGYQISRTITVPPVLVGELLITVGNDGRLAVLHAASATMRWEKRLIAPVVAKPVVADGAVFVAGLDQHIWAYDLSTGRSLWRYLSTSALTSSPAVVGHNLYQQIPGEGVVAFVAQPVDRPGGQVLWTASDVPGDVVGGRNGRIFVWCPQHRRMTILDERSGGVIRRLDLPHITELRVIGREYEEIYAFGSGGRIIRLVAR